jgi:hypothetical protein
VKLYTYVGPAEISARAVANSGGAVIETRADLEAWLRTFRLPQSPAEFTATFVVDSAGKLRLADRRSEHVVCAGGLPVYAAGELTFDTVNLAVVEVTNQSMGYCPEPESWPTVAAALDGVRIEHPGQYTMRLIFRRCPKCGETNIVKDHWFKCSVCGAGLPDTWNYSPTNRE